MEYSNTLIYCFVDETDIFVWDQDNVLISRCIFYLGIIFILIKINYSLQIIFRYKLYYQQNIPNCTSNSRDVFTHIYSMRLSSYVQNMLLLYNFKIKYINYLKLFSNIEPSKARVNSLNLGG